MWLGAGKQRRPLVYLIERILRDHDRIGARGVYDGLTECEERLAATVHRDDLCVRMDCLQAVAPG